MGKIIQFTKDEETIKAEKMEKIKKYYEEKKELITNLFYKQCDFEGSLGEALDLISEMGTYALVIDEYYAYAYTMIAQCYHKLGVVQKATKYGRTATEYALDKCNNINANWILAISYFFVEPKKAINYYKRCLMLCDKDVHQYHILKFNLAYLENDILEMKKAIEGFSSLCGSKNTEFVMDELYEWTSKRYMLNDDKENALEYANKIVNEIIRNKIIDLINMHFKQVAYY